MSEEYWDGRDREVSEDSFGVVNTFTTSLLVNGSNLEMTPGESFKGFVLKAAEDAGLGKFRLFLDGNEIKPSEAPIAISEGMKAEIRPFDIAG